MSGETGFPSPAQGYEAKKINFNDILVKNVPATFVMRARTNRLRRKGIRRGSLLIVDRSVPLAPGRLVVFYHEGKRLCREFRRIDGVGCFVDARGGMIVCSDETVVFGVVTKAVLDV
jgi:DNA polymerase V